MKIIISRLSGENLRPSTAAGYKYLWEAYLASRLDQTALGDFRTVDAANLLVEIHKAHGLGRTTLKHVKAFLTSVFKYAKNQGILDGLNPVRDAMTPRKAAAPKETHAATVNEALAIMGVLENEGEMQARAAVALMFFAGLRPGEARGIRWEDFDGKNLMVRQSVWHTFTTEPKTPNSVKASASDRGSSQYPGRAPRGRQQSRLWTDPARAVWKTIGFAQSRQSGGYPNTETMFDMP